MEACTKRDETNFPSSGLARLTAALPLLAAAVWTVTGLPGCAGETEEVRLERQSSALLYWQPLYGKIFLYELVGHGLNGTSLNGESIAGNIVVAVFLDDVVLAKGGSKDLKLVRTSFRKAGSPKKPIEQQKLVGALFDAVMQDGSAITLRIDGLEEADDSGTPFYRYAVSYESAEGWKPLCGTGASEGSPVLAVPLNGVWNYQKGVSGGGSFIDDEDAFTFACDGYAIAKCVDLGYKPWKPGWICSDQGNGKDCEKTTLAAHHQACTRAIRADYCGDGTPYTVDGVAIGLFDGIGIRDHIDGWQIEAEWNADGALCIAKERLAEISPPPCLAALVKNDCGKPAHFEQGTLVATELEPPQ